MSANTNRYPRWQEARLGDILPLKYGKARSEQYGYSREQTSTFGSNGAFGTFPRALTCGPALLVGRKGAAGSVHYSTEPCWPIDTTYYTEGNEDIHLPFFRYLLESLHLVQFDRSTAIPSLSRDDYNSKLVKFPKELPEQRRIVAEIEKQFSRLEEGVSALKRAQANLKRYRAAVLKVACEGKLVETEVEIHRKHKTKNSKLGFETGKQLLKRILEERRKNWSGRGQYKEPTVPDSTNLPQLPEGWTWATVEQVSESVVDCPHTTPKWTQSGHLCLRTTEFRPGRLDLSEVRYVSESTYKERISRLVPKEGDILYSREGGILGIACQVPHGVNMCLGQRMMLIRAVSLTLGTFVMNWLNSPVILSHVNGLTTGSASPHLNVGEIRLFPVPLPPLAEQKRIVEEVERRLSVVEELESLVNTNLQRATRLRQSILQKAFAGKL